MTVPACLASLFYKAGITAPTSWTEVQKLLADVVAAGDQFGYAVACSSDGSVVVIGAPLKDTADTGAVYIYSGANWATRTKITPSDGAIDDAFGWAVSCSSDGSVVVVGAIEANYPVGAVYVYSGANWSTEAKISSPFVAGFNFGRVVRCSPGGSMVLVSGVEIDTETEVETGKVVGFRGPPWEEDVTVSSSVSFNDSLFGNDVAGVGTDEFDGFIVGAYAENGNAGKVYVYGGYGYEETQVLTASDGASGDAFGYSVACSLNGDVLVVGAPFDDDTYSNAGAVYVFTYSGGSYSQTAKLNASAPAAGDWFGRAVSISSDGNVLAVATDDAANGNRGAVYIFVRSGGVWSQLQKLVTSDAAASDYFGRSLAVSGNGRIIVGGAPLEDTTPVTNNGAAYIFEGT